MTGAPTIGLISNPRSGHNRQQFSALRPALDARVGGLHRVTADCAAVAPALAALRAAGVDILAINGGDGTVATVLGQLLQQEDWPRLPAILILPAGTANMTAGDVGMRGSLRAAVRRFCAWDPRRDAAASLQRRMLRLRDGGRTRHGFFLGGGAVIAGTEFAHASLHARGLRDDFSLALGVARTIWGIARRDPRFLRRTPLTLRADDAPPLSVDGLVLAISTLERLAFGMRPFWGSGAGGARLTLIEHGCRRFVPNFLRIIAGRPGAGCRPQRGYHSLAFDRLQLLSSGQLNLDGELLQGGRALQLTATRPLRFLRP